MKDIPEGELIAPRPIVFGSIIRTINHTYSMDLVWQAHLQNKPHGLTTRNPVNVPTLEYLTVVQGKLDGWYVSYADTLSESAEDEVIDFEFIGSGMGSLNRSSLLKVTKNRRYFILIYLDSIDLEGSHIMLIEGFEGSEFGMEEEDPNGKGIGFQIQVNSIQPILDRMKAIDWPLAVPVEENWYRVYSVELG